MKLFFRDFCFWQQFRDSCFRRNIRIFFRNFCFDKNKNFYRFFIKRARVSVLRKYKKILYDVCQNFCSQRIFKKFELNLLVSWQEVNKRENLTKTTGANMTLNIFIINENYTFLKSIHWLNFKKKRNTCYFQREK